jgi:branched-chain amino acid transport system substrate-binding protein
MRKIICKHNNQLFKQAGIILGLIAILALVAAPATAEDAPKIKVGLVTFLSGGAAGPFGIPARNGSELMIEAINAGKVPAPYNKKGIAGAQLETVLIDEAGNAQKQVTEYRKLIQKQKVDVVIGYISSGHCKAIAPVAEELGTLTIFFDCGTPQIFEDIVTAPKYLFRTGGTATMDNVAAARYLHKSNPDLKSIAGINQNYAWGQDSWRDFSESMKQLKPDVKVVTEQFPKIYAGQYGAEISALLSESPDVVHTSFWGGDMEAFILQGSVRGVFKKSEVVLTAGETAMHRLGTQMPDGTVLGGRGPFGNFAPDSELNKWFRKQYFDRYNTWPTYPAYKGAQALLGLKAAYEKAAKEGALPETDQVVAALENLVYEGPGGTVKMALANGHQAILDTAYGRYKYDKSTGQATLTDVINYKAECVNPPEGVKSLDWIQSGFKGAQCD